MRYKDKITALVSSHEESKYIPPTSASKIVPKIDESSKSDKFFAAFESFARAKRSSSFPFFINVEPLTRAALILVRSPSLIFENRLYNSSDITAPSIASPRNSNLSLFFLQNFYE